MAAALSSVRISHSYRHRFLLTGILPSLTIQYSPMSIQRSLLFKSLVTPFYRQNAALLIFIYYIMTLAVGRANGVGMLEYHYSLIRGMLTEPSFLLTIFGVWLAYAIKCGQFVISTLRKPAFSYLYQLSLVNKKKVYLLLLKMQG